ncbi:hypothetical protein ACAN107058_14655 [Paracidovorax anthurii]
MPVFLTAPESNDTPVATTLGTTFMRAVSVTASPAATLVDDVLRPIASFTATALAAEVAAALFASPP